MCSDLQRNQNPTSNEADYSHHRTPTRARALESRYAPFKPSKQPDRPHIPSNQYNCQRATAKECATLARLMLTHAEKRRRSRRQGRCIGLPLSPVNKPFKLFANLPTPGDAPCIACAPLPPQFANTKIRKAFSRSSGLTGRPSARILDRATTGKRARGEKMGAKPEADETEQVVE
jgi:hypothetical protein